MFTRYLLRAQTRTRGQIVHVTHNDVLFRNVFSFQPLVDDALYISVFLRLLLQMATLSLLTRDGPTDLREMNFNELCA